MRSKGINIIDNIQLYPALLTINFFKAKYEQMDFSIDCLTDRCDGCYNRNCMSMTDKTAGAAELEHQRKHPVRIVFYDQSHAIPGWAVKLKDTHALHFKTALDAREFINKYVLFSEVISNN